MSERGTYVTQHIDDSHDYALVKKALSGISSVSTPLSYVADDNVVEIGVLAGLVQTSYSAEIEDVIADTLDEIEGQLNGIITVVVISSWLEVYKVTVGRKEEDE